MTIETNATLLTAESKPYEIEGNKGVSHKARFLIDGEIYKVNCKPEDITFLSAVKENNPSNEPVVGSLILSFSSPKENMKVQFVSFE